MIFDPFMAKNVNQIGAFWEPIFGQKLDKIWRQKEGCGGHKRKNVHKRKKRPQT